jgi:hypothetical protein
LVIAGPPFSSFDAQHRPDRLLNGLRSPIAKKILPVNEEECTQLLDTAQKTVAASPAPSWLVL